MGIAQRISLRKLETGCPKLAVVRFVGVLFFQGDHYILRYKHEHAFTS